VVDEAIGVGVASDRLTDLLMELFERIAALENKDKPGKPKNKSPAMLRR
jgi:hypothetical protein